MTHKRIFLQDLTDRHLLLILDALQYSPWDSAEDYMQQIAEGKMELYEIGEGLVAFRLGEKQAEVVFVVGPGLIERKEEVVAAAREFARGLPVEAFLVHAGMVRLASKMGFKPVGAYMRLD